MDVVLLDISSGHREATTPMTTSGQGKLYSWSRGYVQEEHTHTKTESSSGFCSIAEPLPLLAGGGVQPHRLTQLANLERLGAQAMKEE